MRHLQKKGLIIGVSSVAKIKWKIKQHTYLFCLSRCVKPVLICNEITSTSRIGLQFVTVMSCYSLDQGCIFNLLRGGTLDFKCKKCSLHIWFYFAIGYGWRPKHWCFNFPSLIVPIRISFLEVEKDDNYLSRGLYIFARF